MCNVSFSCQDKPSSFCYGEVVLKSQWRPLSKLARNVYVLYFGCKVGDQDKV